jgi:hypothetical protein
VKSAKATFDSLRERAAGAVSACLAWLKRRSRRDFVLSGLALALVLASIVAVVFSGTLARYYRVIAAPAGTVPLSEESRSAMRGKAKQLATALQARLDAKKDLAGEAWPSAQIMVALRENDPDYARRIDSRTIERYFRSVAGPECACWRRLPKAQFPNHLGLSAWVLWALAVHGIPAQRGEIEFLLSTQDRDGGWPIFADARQKQSSSYATAAAIFALHQQSKFEPNAQRRARLATALQRGADWLKSRAAPGRARWADYPGGREYLGVSGFVLYVLHRVGAPGLAELDRAWLRELPMGEALALGGQISPKSIQVGKRSYRDDTRHYALPWGVLATVLAYPTASLGGKARAIEWLELNLGPGAPVYSLTGRGRDVSIGAETLLALRVNLQAKHD